MFKKLRNKFLLLNLIIISIMMIIAFISIYLISYNTIYKDIDSDIRKVSGFDFSNHPSPSPNPSSSGDNKKKPPPQLWEQSASFIFFIDSSLAIQSVSSVFNAEMEFYESAKKLALSKNASRGTFEMGGRCWSFHISPHPQGYKLVFLDTTAQQAILKNLIYAFSLVALFTSVTIFFISRFFANKVIEPIKEAFEKQRQFVADASHNLKTPLTVIHTNIDVLLSNGDDYISNQLKWIHYVKSEIERMTKLTNDLLYLTKIDYSDARMNFKHFSLSEAVENIILAMEAVFFENNIQLTYQVRKSLKIHGNEEQIKQVIIILLDNAVKYTPTKGLIDISLQKSGSTVVLSVSNTGRGIPGEHLSRIFDRFYRVDPSWNESNGSYGLGLSIAKAIVEQHSGKISVKSTLNQNTTFTIELPV